ncbi:BfmA/BtgA family mobilization protein [Maribacter sp. 2210JD10-5]|uniref:BfmA/BtgA family mobilization protein n=1 Tax=Maribacter sp. 2210JD10-5 TaxID=3386272 RepID=UPI0039BD3A94
MDEDLRKEKFETFKIKASVAKKFRRYCRAISRSQSMTLLLMIEFFEHNRISPMESMGPNMETLKSLIKKRNNAVIAIMKSIEKDQTKPAIAILQSLLEGGEPKKKPLILEKRQIIEQREVRFREKKNRLKQ